MRGDQRVRSEGVRSRESQAQIYNQKAERRTDTQTMDRQTDRQGGQTDHLASPWPGPSHHRSSGE